MVQIKNNLAALGHPKAFALSEDGQLVAKILDEYMQGFQRRNPTLRVFSAHLHMDEATPHLHIDFIPYITGSKRGLETRVSLKKAFPLVERLKEVVKNLTIKCVPLTEQGKKLTAKVDGQQKQISRLTDMEKEVMVRLCTKIGAAVAIPFMFVVNGEREWYNQICKFGLRR